MTTEHGEVDKFIGTTVARLNEGDRRMEKIEQAQKEHPQACDLRPQVKDLEQRMRNMEKAYWKAVGIIAAVQFVGFGAILVALKSWLP